MSEITLPRPEDSRRFYRPNAVAIFGGMFRAFGVGSLIGVGVGVLCALWLIVMVFVLMPVVSVANEIGTLLLPISKDELSWIFTGLIPLVAYYGVVIGGTAGVLSGLVGYSVASVFVPVAQLPVLYKVHARGMFWGTVIGMAVCPVIAFVSASSLGKAVVPKEVTAMAFEQLQGWCPSGGMVVGGLVSLGWAVCRIHRV